MGTNDYTELERECATLRAALEEAKQQVSYFRGIAAKGGQGRLRERTQLGELVSEIKSSRVSLEKERNQLLSIFDSLDDKIFVSCIDSGKIIYANKQAYVEHGPLLDKSLMAQVFGSEEEGSLGNSLAALLEAGDHGLASEFQHPLSHKLYRNLSRCLTWPDRGLVRFDMFVDITEARKLEDEVVLRQKMESVGRLAGGIAHDFNNILMAIVGSLSLIELAESKEDQSELLAEINDACRRAMELNNQLLTFSKGGAPVMKAAALPELVVKTVNFVLKGAKAKPIYDLAEDLHEVEVDPIQISQVIQNLVINADQAMAMGGKIWISASNVEQEDKDSWSEVGEDGVKIVIRDEGCGISEAHRTRIFEPYFTTKSHGHGLGLAASYAIIKNHGGQIAVHSVEGEGSTFEIFLRASNKVLESEPEVVAEPLKGRGKILVVDDEEMVLQTIRRFLKRLGYEFVGAETGEEAVQIYTEAMSSEFPIAAVVMDLIIPGAMGGEETQARLSEIDPDLCSIISSGYSNTEIMSHYKDYGFKDVLRKPYTMADIGEVLNRLVEH